MKLKTNINRESCVGCFACAQVCRKKCISAERDGLGFLFPKFDVSLCVDCGVCASVCPANHDSLSNISAYIVDKAYSAVSKDHRILKLSSSGGAFSAIVSEFCDGDTLIFGAKFGESFSAEIDCVKGAENIAPFRGSKYIQAYSVGSFKKAAEFLKSGGKVLYSGTPCQIAALRLFLKKDFENLLTVDVSCHGVASPEVFKKYISALEENFGKKIVKYSFREKSRFFFKKNSKSSSIEFSDGSRKVFFNDDFIKAFMQNVILRESCYNCPFASRRRYSDISLADFWGIELIDEKLDMGNGVSLLTPNSPKGKSIVEKLDSYMNLQQREVEPSLRWNGGFNAPVKRNILRERMTEILKSEDSKFMSELKILTKTKTSVRTKIVLILETALPRPIFNFIKKSLCKIRK